MNLYESQLYLVAPWAKTVMSELKTINNGSFLDPRTGWVRRDIKQSESIFEHTCKLALAAYFLFGTKDAIDQCIIHDAPEIFTGDEIPWEISASDKFSNEQRAIKNLSQILTDGPYWEHQFNKFESKKGFSEYLTQLDKICPAIQALNYNKNPENRNKNLEEFYPYALSKLTSPNLMDILNQMHIIEIPDSVDAYSIYFDKLKSMKQSVLY